MVRMQAFASNGEWLKQRESIIGGSDAGAILGVNKWKSNVELWEEKTGLRKAANISDNPLVKYGSQAEDYLRELFKLDYPHFKVSYTPFNMWRNDKYPWAHASLDGWIDVPYADGTQKGVLEIKTATITSRQQREEWQDKIPQSYYAQVLHYLMVTEFDFAIVKAQLKYEPFENHETYLVTQHYVINRDDVEGDIKLLEEKEKEFAECIRNGVRPSLVLPEI